MVIDSDLGQSAASAADRAGFQRLMSEVGLGRAGIVMGLAWAAGSVGVLATGFFADIIGARSAALISVPVLFVGSILAFHPLLHGHRRPVYS